MNYLEKFKSIYENYSWCWLDTDYLVDTHMIANAVVYLNEVFSHKSYELNSKKQTFHNREIYKYLKNNKQDKDIAFSSIKNFSGNVIVQAGLHPVSEVSNPIECTRTHFIDKFLSDDIVLEKMRNGTMTLFLYQGWEAEDFTNSKLSYPTKFDKYNSLYEMFKSVLDDYQLPKKSIVIISSNLYGNDVKEDYGVNIIYDNCMEMNSFIGRASSSDERYKMDYDYSVDEYLENVKTSNKVICRMSRTKDSQRDFMLYYIYRLKWLDKSLIEHKFFNNDNLENNSLYDLAKEFCMKNDELKYLAKYFDKVQDTKILDKINKDLPFTASDIEKHKSFVPQTIHSNLPIPYDVYKKTIFSWVSTSLPDRKDMIFLNQSTFNPILHYHPILWLSYPNTTKYFKKCGYKSYDWLFESESKIDNSEFFHERFVYNIHEIYKIMNMSKDELYNKLKDNKDVLVHNRNLLLECKSIERIITKLYGVLNETKI